MASDDDAKGKGCGLPDCCHKCSDLPDPVPGKPAWPVVLAAVLFLLVLTALVRHLLPPGVTAAP